MTSESTTSRPTGGQNQPEPDLKYGRALGERLVDAKGVDEDIATVIADNWQRLVGGLIVVLVGVWLWGEFSRAESRKLGEASSRFQATQAAFAALSAEKSDGTPAEDPTTIEQRLRDSITLLEKSHSDSIYGELVPLYSVARLIQTKQFGEAERALEQYPVSAVNTSGSLSKKSFVQELATLLRARLLLAKGGDRVVVRGLLESLVKNGQFTNVEALIILLRIAETPEEHAQATALAKDLRASAPFLGEALDRQLEILGIRLE